MNQTVIRKLAAIVAADMVGYSRRMGADEEGTLAQLKTHRSQIIDPAIADHHGRIFKTTGDGLLAEFASVVDAVRCAVAMQKGMAERDAGVPEDRRIAFRIGVNLGDVIVEGDDIYGDGVNVAARLQGLAAPGGICVSHIVHDQVCDKLDIAFDDLGENSVKNIARPVRAYRVRLTPHATPNAIVAGEPPPLPDKPSIAVLPFGNLSGDPEQDYFSDGVTEDIITALSRMRWFFVIARNSTFSYKGQSLDVREVARRLGVAYVLEGSVRKAGNRVRITAQLIDGATGKHVWAKRYDRELADIFTLQDEITETIVGAIEPEISRAEREQAKAKRPDNLRAWDLIQRAMWHTYRRTKEDLAEAQRLFEQARKEAPDLALAYAGAEEACFFQYVGGYAGSSGEVPAEGVRLAKRAVELDSLDAFSHYSLGRALTLTREHRTAIPHLETAISLNPSFAQAYYALGMALGTSGRPAEAIPHLETAMRLSPRDPYLGQFMLHMSEAYLFLRRHEEAVDWARRSLRQPNIQWSRWAGLASALAHLGALDEARQSIEALRQLKPEVSIAFVRNYWPISDLDSCDHLLNGLRKANLPD